MAAEMTNKLLENAVAAIQLGVEDSQSDNSKRSLSAVRNIYAGILLLFKERLRQFCPEDSNEVLLKERLVSRIGENGKLVFIGAGTKTVDVQGIKNHFNSLGIKADWKRFDALNKLRNELEHYYSSATSAQLQEVLAQACGVLYAFIRDELTLEPRALLGERVWTHMLSQTELYDKELILCREQMRQLSWPTEELSDVAEFLHCNNCESKLIFPVKANVQSVTSLTFKCNGCGEEMEFDDIIEAAIDEAYFGETYVSMTDGGDPPLDWCEHCGRTTFHVESGNCLACLGCHKYRTCAICHKALDSAEQHLRGLCEYHHHSLTKDD